MNTLQDRIKLAIEKHPDWTDARIAKSFKGCRAAEVRRLRPAGIKASAPIKKIGMSRGEFMARYDPTTRVRKQLAAAAKLIQRGIIYKDYELRREVGCSDARLWREIAKDPDEGLSELQFAVTGEGVYWSDAATVREILETVTKAKAVT